MIRARIPFDYEAAIEACSRGDHAALKAIYDLESPWLLGVALRIVRNLDAAHDVLQDSFLQLWQRSGSYQRALGSGRGWIYTVVRHRALDEVRLAGREVAVGDGLEALLERAADHRADMATHAHAAALSDCIATLEERSRDCIVHAFVDGYTHEEIAVKVAAPIGSVKSWIRRGLLALKACLA